MSLASALPGSVMTMLDTRVIVEGRRRENVFGRRPDPGETLHLAVAKHKNRQDWSFYVTLRSCRRWRCCGSAQPRQQH